MESAWVRVLEVLGKFGGKGLGMRAWKVRGKFGGKGFESARKVRGVRDWVCGRGKCVESSRGCEQKEGWVR